MRAKGKQMSKNAKRSTAAQHNSLAIQNINLQYRKFVDL